MHTRCGIYTHTHRIHVWYIYPHLPYKCKAIKYTHTYHTWILWDNGLSSSDLSFCWRPTFQSNGSWPSSSITPSNYDPNSPNIFCLAVVQSDKKNVSRARFVKIPRGRLFSSQLDFVVLRSTLGRSSVGKVRKKPNYIVYNVPSEMNP